MGVQNNQSESQSKVECIKFAQKVIFKRIIARWPRTQQQRIHLWT